MDVDRLIRAAGSAFIFGIEKTVRSGVVGILTSNQVVIINAKCLHVLSVGRVGVRQEIDTPVSILEPGTVCSTRP